MEESRHPQENIKEGEGSESQIEERGLGFMQSRSHQHMSWKALRLGGITKEEDQDWTLGHSNNERSGAKGEPAKKM